MYCEIWSKKQDLAHCAQYEAKPEVEYSQWAEKLSINEMYAYSVSEVFIYFFFEPTLVGKTF